MDPVLTDAISRDDTGGYFMDVAKNDEDESSELFGIPSQSQNWNACPTQSLNTPIAGHSISISSSFPESRFLRLSSDFQEAEDLQTSFGDLNAPEGASPGQYCFTRPADRVAIHLDDFEEENGFDSGFGSLQLTPTEINSEGLCDSSSPQSTPFRINLTKEPKMECEEQNFSSSFNPHISSQQPLQLIVEYEAPKIGRDVEVFDQRADSRASSHSVQDGSYLNGVRPLTQTYGLISRNRQNSLYHQMPSTPAFTKPSIYQTPSSNNTFPSSSSSSYLHEMSRSAPSPVSHRNLNKRVTQQEASEFLSSSEGGNWDENFDDIDSFGIEADFDDTVLPSSVERSSPQVSPSHGRYRNYQSFSLRRGQHSPLSGTNRQRSRSTVMSTTSIERPRKVGAPRNGGRKRNLLNFILELLTTRQNCVEWVDKPKQVFQIVNPDQLTRLWGEHKNNIKMSFDSLSRSLRLYYKPGKLERIPGTRHQYRLIHKAPECSDLLCEPPYGCNSDHRKSNTSMGYSNSFKQQSSFH
nr:ETS transcription factor Elf 2 [Hymenolepis microstoma]